MCNVRNCEDVYMMGEWVIEHHNPSRRKEMEGEEAGDGGSICFAVSFLRICLGGRDLSF